MTLSIDSTELIYLVFGPGALLLIVLLLRADSKLRAHYEEVSRRLAAVELELRELRRLARDDSRELELEKRLATLTQQHEQLLLRDTEAGPYHRAARLAEKGADAGDLIEQTGITRAEADLILSLHGRTAADEVGSGTDES